MRIRIVTEGASPPHDAPSVRFAATTPVSRGRRSGKLCRLAEGR
jgi:hypothetical protein